MLDPRPKAIPRRLGKWFRVARVVGGGAVWSAAPWLCSSCLGDLRTSAGKREYSLAQFELYASNVRDHRSDRDRSQETRVSNASTTKTVRWTRSHALAVARTWAVAPSWAVS